MLDRKSALLSAIIREHIETGNTVASKSVVDNHNFKLSPATIRNEMVTLEKEGYIYQPHTSAGRIPTEKGWKLYIDNFIKEIDLSDKHKSVLDEILKEQGLSKDMVVKKVARGLAEISKDAVFVGFDPDDFYYTGLSNLFRQPEFQKVDLVCHVSEVVDHLDEVIHEMFEEVTRSGKAKVMVGSDNPFGKECSSIVMSFNHNNDKQCVFGVLGPLRMDYENNLALIKYARELFTNA